MRYPSAGFHRRNKGTPTGFKWPAKSFLTVSVVANEVHTVRPARQTCSNVVGNGAKKRASPTPTTVVDRASDSVRDDARNASDSIRRCLLTLRLCHALVTAFTPFKKLSFVHRSAAVTLCVTGGRTHFLNVAHIGEGAINVLTYRE